MNIFLPQSIQTQIELEEIADVQRQIITPTSSKPIIGIEQDGLIGSFNMTQPEVTIDWKTVMNLMAYIKIDDYTKLEKNKVYKGNEIFSTIIPNKINIKKSGCDIVEGFLKKGIITDSLIGSKKANAIHHLIWDEYGAYETRTFLDNVQRLTNNYNFYNGFSVGIGDLETKDNIMEQIKNLIQQKLIKVNYLITEVENNPGLLPQDILENNIFSEVNIIRNDAGKLIIDNMTASNSMYVMFKSGSKGSDMNITKAIGCVGMEQDEGRLQSKITNGRTLPFFFKNNDGGSSRGLSTRSFIDGNVYSEFFYGNVSGRQGIIDGVVRTADSGYMQRKLVKTMEDATIRYDGTVRTANNAIIQYVYGDTGADTTKQFDYTVNFLEMGNKEIASIYKLKDEDLKEYGWSKSENDEYYNKIISMRDTLRDISIKSKLSRRQMALEIKIPVNFKRIIETVKNDKHLKESKEKLKAQYIIQKLEEIQSNKVTKLFTIKNELIDNQESIKNKDEIKSKTTFVMALYDSLAPSKCFYEYNLNKIQFDEIISKIIKGFNGNLAEPGEMVGVIAAQSLGEPVSQMTLKSVDYETDILIINNGKSNVVKIGELIDDLIINPNTIKIADNAENEMADTHYLDIKDKNMFIQSVTENGNILWKQIEAVTKHLTLNADGTKTILKVTTKSGKVVMATKSQSFLTRINNKIVPIRGDELKIGTYLPVMFRSQKFGTNEIENHNNINLIMDDIIPGTIINSKKCDIERNKYKYIHANEFDKKVINNIVNSDVYYDPIISIQEVNPTHTYVYDFTVADTKTFCIFNGLCVMDSFHTAGVGSGVSNTTSGVTRLNELMRLSKKIKTPQMIIYQTEEYMESNEMANKIASYIHLTTLGQLITSSEVIYDPQPYKKGGHMEKDNVTNVYSALKPTKTSCQSEIDGLPWLLRLELDREKMLIKEITLLDIKSKFCNYWNKRFNDKTIKKTEEKQIFDKITQIALLSNTNNDDIPVIHIRFEMSEYNLNIPENFLKVVINNFKIKGIHGITNIVPNAQKDVVITYDKTNFDIIKKYQYPIITVGINLFDIRYINNIDLSYTTSNDIMIMYETFGIESARALLAYELGDVFAKAGTSVNPNHLSLLVDLITKDGILTSIDRHGMNKTDVDPLARASFEKMDEQLLNAAVYGETDYMKGVSSRIMAGLVIKAGTGLCDIVLDTEMLEKSEYYDEKQKQTHLHMDESTIIQHITQEDSGEMFIPE